MFPFFSSGKFEVLLVFKNKQERDNFLEFSNKNNVMTRPAWTLMNKLKMFKDCQSMDLKNAKYFELRAVNIPSSSVL